MADFFEAREVPAVGKLTTLLRLDGLHSTAMALQENTLAIGFVHQRKPLSVGTQAGEILDKLVLAQPQEPGEAADLGLGKTDLSRPPTTGGATLAFVVERHADPFSPANHAVSNSENAECDRVSPRRQILHNVGQLS